MSAPACGFQWVLNAPQLIRPPLSMAGIPQTMLDLRVLQEDGRARDIRRARGGCE